MCSRTPSTKMRGWPPTSRSSVTSCCEPVPAVSSSHRTLPARSVALMIPNVGSLWSPAFLSPTRVATRALSVSNAKRMLSISVDLQVPRAPMIQVRLRPNSTGQASRKPDEVDTAFR